MVTLAVLAGIIIILIIAAQGDAFGAFGTFARRLFNPFSVIVYKIGQVISPDVSDGVTAADLRSQLEQVQSENRRLSAENIRLATLENENKQLREYLNFRQTRNLSLQMAEITARGNSEDSLQNRQIITLNQGAEQGLRPGLPIVSSEGVLIGKITEVKQNSAQACLLYSPDCRFAVGLDGSSTTLGIAHGDLGLTTLIEFIPQNQNIAVGQMATTTGLESGMPPGLLLGKISRVIKQGNELWQSAVIEPIANFDDLRFVAVLK